MKGFCLWKATGHKRKTSEGGQATGIDRMIEATGLLERWTQITAEDTPAAMRWVCLQALNLLRGCQRAGTISQAYVCDMLLGRCRSSKSVVECNKVQRLHSTTTKYIFHVSQTTTFSKCLLCIFQLSAHSNRQYVFLYNRCTCDFVICCLYI